MNFRRRRADEEDPEAPYRIDHPPELPAEPGRHVDQYGTDPGYRGGYAPPTAAPAPPYPEAPYPEAPPYPAVQADPADGGYVAYADVAPHLEELGRLRTERGSLIELCLYARDRVNSPAAAERIDAGLTALGITPLRPDGEPFDPGQHEAAASIPTDDPGRHGRVAETEVPGYADRGMVVRPPVVSVYRRENAP